MSDNKLNNLNMSTDLPDLQTRNRSSQHSNTYENVSIP